MLEPVPWILPKCFLTRKTGRRHGSSTAIQGRRCHLCHHMQSTLPLPCAPAPPLEDLPWRGRCQRGGGQGAPRVCGDRGYKGCVLALHWLWDLGVYLWIWQKKRVFPTGWRIPLKTTSCPLSGGLT